VFPEKQKNDACNLSANRNGYKPEQKQHGTGNRKSLKNCNKPRISTDIGGLLQLMVGIESTTAGYR
jgi:hypothetical protein